MNGLTFDMLHLLNGLAI